MFLNYLHRCITLCIDANVSLKLKFEFSARLHRWKHLCIDATSRCMLCIDARWVCIDANLKEWLKITSKCLGLISNLLESIPMLLYLWKQVLNHLASIELQDVHQNILWVCVERFSNWFLTRSYLSPKTLYLSSNVVDLSFLLLLCCFQLFIPQRWMLVDLSTCLFIQVVCWFVFHVVCWFVIHQNLRIQTSHTSNMIYNFPLFDNDKPILRICIYKWFWKQQ